MGGSTGSRGGEYIEAKNSSGGTTVAASSSSLLLLIHNLCAALDLAMRRRHDFGSSDDDLAYYVSALHSSVDRRGSEVGSANRSDGGLFFAPNECCLVGRSNAPSPSEKQESGRLITSQ